MSTVSSELALHDIIPGGKPILLMKSIWTDSRQASKSLLESFGGRPGTRLVLECYNYEIVITQV